MILGPSSFKLRQQNLSAGNGRVYEIEFSATDGAGNRGAVQSCFFGVRTARESPRPINDGRVFTVRP